MATVRAICMQAIGADGIVGSFDRGQGRGRTGGFWALGRSHRMRPQLFLCLMKQKREELLFPTDTSLPHRRGEANYMRGTRSSWCKKKCRFSHLPRTNEIPPTRIHLIISDTIRPLSLLFLAFDSIGSFLIFLSALRETKKGERRIDLRLVLDHTIGF